MLWMEAFAACDSIASISTNCTASIRDVPEEDQFGFLQEAQRAGKIRHIGLSEVSVGQIERARRFFDVVAVQNRLTSSIASGTPSSILHARRDCVPAVGAAAARRHAERREGSGRSAWPAARRGSRHSPASRRAIARRERRSRWPGCSRGHRSWCRFPARRWNAISSRTSLPPRSCCRTRSRRPYAS